MSSSPFCSVELAARIEKAELALITAATDGARTRSTAAFVTPVAGAAACYVEEGSPMNKVVGLGFAGVPSAEALAGIEKAFADRESPVQVELSTLADPDVGAALTGRGYQLVGFENVSGRLLDDVPAAPPGVEVRPAEPDEFDEWLEVVVDGFANPDEQGVPSHEAFPRDIVGRAIRDMADAGVRSYVGLLGGVIAGEGSIRMTDGVAQLTGAATAPRHRRRGVQTALLATRLRIAADAGCDIAVVTTQPGSKSQQNVQRQGFHLLYPRAVLVKFS
jgi:GNAT superfamily N-acetyltransferase